MPGQIFARYLCNKVLHPKSPRTSSLHCKRKNRVPRRNTHELPSANQIAHRVSPYNTAKILPPHFLTRFRVERKKIAFVAAAEHQLTRRRKHSRPRLDLQLVIPPALSGMRSYRAK